MRMLLVSGSITESQLWPWQLGGSQCSQGLVTGGLQGKGNEGPEQSLPWRGGGRELGMVAWS